MRTTRFRTPARNGIISTTGGALPLIFTSLSELLTIDIFPRTLTINLALSLLLLSPVENEGEMVLFLRFYAYSITFMCIFGLLKLTTCSQKNLVFWYRISQQVTVCILSSPWLTCWKRAVRIRYVSVCDYLYKG